MEESEEEKESDNESSSSEDESSVESVRIAILSTWNLRWQQMHQ